MSQLESTVAHQGRLLLWPGLLLVSTSGPFIVATGLSTTPLVLYRLAGSGALFVLWAWMTRSMPTARGHHRQLIAGGALMSAHFLLWIKAFELTDFASNMLLLVSQPVLAAVVGAKLGERTTRATWWSVGLALVGLLSIAGGDIALGPRALFGDLLSILSNVAITVFFVVTRRARSAMPLAPFMGWVMSTAAVVTLPFAFASGASFVPPQASGWGWLAGLVLLGTVGGHGLMNVAARHVQLFTLSVVILLEPVIGIAMGAVMFDASVTWPQVAGGAVLAVAVVVGLAPDRRSETALVSGPVG